VAIQPVAIHSGTHSGNTPWQFNPGHSPAQFSNSTNRNYKKEMLFIEKEFKEALAQVF
jgi:hypothetical protein